MRETDVITRERVLRAAARLFAAQGFARVTVRDICAEAGANVSAVNYHFGDKRALYDEVLDRAAATIHETTELARAAAAGRPADERLRVYIRTFLERALGPLVEDRWIHELMTRELADATPALARFSERAIRPRLEYVASMIGERLRLPADHPVVRRCVLSIQSQLHGTLAPEMVRRLLPDLQDATALGRWADHIADFSLAGLDAAARGLLRCESEAGLTPATSERV